MALPQRATASQDQILALIDRRRTDSLRYNYTTFAKCKQWYAMFRGITGAATSTPQFRNTVSLNYLYGQMNSHVARMVQTCFGVWPIVSFDGYAPEDVPLAKKREVLISAQMKDCGSIAKANDFFMQAAICGTAIARYGWKNITRKTRYTSYEAIAPGLTVPVLNEGMMTKFNGPTWEVVDRLDFWQQPGIKCIDDMAWVIHRYWRDWDDLMDDANGPYPYFDREQVLKLGERPLLAAARDEYTSRRLMFRSDYDYMARQNEGYAKPVEIWEMHGLVPSEMAPDGVRDRCIAIGNGTVVLKNQPSILPSGQKMFLSFSPNPDPYGFDGIGKAEAGERVQRTIDRIANQKLDAVDLVIDPTYLARSDANLNTQNLWSRAGKIYTVDGGQGALSDIVQPLTPDLRGLQMAYTEIAQLREALQYMTGETDALLGQRGSGDETARGFLGRQENALSRVSNESKLAEEVFVERLADAFVDLDRIFLPPDYEVKVIGSLSMVNPISGLPYPEQRVQIGPEDLRPDYRARAVGASQTMNRGTRQQNYLSFFQIAASSPVGQTLINWPNMLREGAELFGFKNIADFVVSQIPQTNAAMMQQGQPGPGGGGAMSQGLDQLSPGTIGNQGSPSPIPMVST